MEELIIKLPPIEAMEKVRVKLDQSRIVTYKDGRKTNPKIISFTPKKLIEYNDKKGVYIILKIDGSVGYVGATTIFGKRVRTHKFLIDNPNIKFVYFLELEEKNKRYVFEIMYKYYFFKKVRPEFFHF